MRNIIAFAAIALLLSAVLGCAPAEPESGVSEETEIGADMSGIEEMDSELDMSELESLEQEFAELEALFS